jgi:hypothetical protein
VPPEARLRQQLHPAGLVHRTPPRTQGKDATPAPRIADAGRPFNRSSPPAPAPRGRQPLARLKTWTGRISSVTSRR